MQAVQVGQVWSDKDKRRSGRTFEVMGINNNLADCELVSNGLKKRTKVRLDRFKPKYYALSTNNLTMGTAVVATSASAVGVLAPTVGLHNQCSKVINGNWGSFGNYALCDNDRINIILRQVRDDCFDVKVRIDGHLISSEVFKADLQLVLGQVKARLVALRNNISNVVD